ncbi:MAG TPA: hypothetical protein VGS96_15865 [Thermoanaerobaculia bacterium]|jgi:hypothetical protein|nr:hypothetical protein [Thermoanaerobaculia bacterium]
MAFVILRFATPLESLEKMAAGPEARGNGSAPGVRADLVYDTLIARGGHLGTTVVENLNGCPESGWGIL